MTDKPILEYKTVIQDSGDPGYTNRLMVGTATTGLVRIEWVQARYGQIIPVNWSMVQMQQYVNAFYPLRYQVDDAQNLIVQEAVTKEFVWLLLLEHDTIPPPDAFLRFNKYIRDADIPVVSGLYYTRSRPSEPLVFRADGTSFYDKWTLGEQVWVDRVPTGCLLIHCGVLREMYAEAEEYMIGEKRARRVFETPRDMWFDPESRQHNTVTGTSDLAWCRKMIDGDYLRKAGWKEIAKKKYPLLIDTNIFYRHINMDGEQFP